MIDGWPKPPRERRPYGQAARLGLIVPTTNTVNEAEWGAALPDGVTMHVARMALHTDTRSDAGKAALERDIAVAARSLADAEVDVIAYGCTAGSLTLPLDVVPDMIARATGLPGVATAPSLVRALRVLGAARVAVATPYDAGMNEHERVFLEACGIVVVAIEGLGAGERAAFRRIHLLTAGEVGALATRVTSSVPGGAYDALVLSCTDLPTLGLHEELEEALGKPVVSSNQATLWAALRAAGVQGGWGRLSVPGLTRRSPASAR